MTGSKMKIISKSNGYLELENTSVDDKWWAAVKFDGGVHFNLKNNNGKDDDADYLFIGDIDEMIETLQNHWH